MSDSQTFPLCPPHAKLERTHGIRLDFGGCVQCRLNELARLREKLAAAEKQVQCGGTGLLYAEPILSQLWGIRERFDEEMQNHLKEALAQVRRSQNDIRKLAIIDGKDVLKEGE